MRPIDGDALADVLTAISSIKVDTGRSEEWAVTVNAARQAIAQMPTIEPKKGKWIKARGSWCTPGGDPVWECPECGKGVHVYGIEHGTYGADIADGQWAACPNCGARMENGDDSN